jgi:L-ornithine N5-monooxygenase
VTGGDGDGGDVLDILGIGFGPSNLALAIALDELGPAAPRALFLEKQARFGWHRGMLLDDATMQVSFFKDLVTMRNPTSDFSFLCYLRSAGRLVEFVNHKTLFPLRIEFHDYFRWAAERMRHLVRYSAEVISIEPVRADGRVAFFDVLTREQADVLVVRRARNICVATGLQPRLPADALTSDRVWHNVDLIGRAAQLAADPPRRVVVVGAGQSAAETVAYLHRRFADAEICATPRPTTARTRTGSSTRTRSTCTTRRRRT